ncbi:hypothetical protein ACHAW5_009459 [Stephanodiscus triporus]|uniref:Uncharacterized protein n=1 Tax=Stephanodiscus triporus TaxID=2934178 RepID=A0ABD3NMP0_9STRA
MILSLLGIDVYCVDLLGWGYTQLNPSVLSYSARAKVETYVDSGRWWAGTGKWSTPPTSSNDYGDGGDFVRGTVLINAQGFVDGIGPMSYLPVPIARLGIRVLKSEPLRSSANRMSYYDVESYATEDALRVGRLHVGERGAQLSCERGFRPGEKVPAIGVPTKEYAKMFVNGHARRDVALDRECGHVPHLEQLETTARHIADFLMSEGVRPSRRGGSTSSASRKRASATGAAAATATSSERNDNNGDSVDHRRNNNYYGGDP